MTTPEIRPEWAYQAFKTWHDKHCDPVNCGYEGSFWFKSGADWCRSNYAGTVVSFSEDGSFREIRK